MYLVHSRKKMYIFIPGGNTKWAVVPIKLLVLYAILLRSDLRSLTMMVLRKSSYLAIHVWDRTKTTFCLAPLICSPISMGYLWSTYYTCDPHIPSKSIKSLLLWEQYTYTIRIGGIMTLRMFLLHSWRRSITSKSQRPRC